VALPGEKYFEYSVHAWFGCCPWKAQEKVKANTLFLEQVNNLRQQHLFFGFSSRTTA